eukprot:Pgem_evm1s31
MINEINSAVNFIVSIVQKRITNETTINNFKNILTKLLTEKFEKQNCWHLKQPWRGSSNRCIRIDDRMDPIIDQAAKLSSVQNINLLLPAKCLVWIDPNEVCYKLTDSDRAPNTILYAKEYEESPISETSTFTYNSSSVTNSPNITPPLSPKQSYNEFTNHNNSSINNNNNNINNKNRNT